MGTELAPLFVTRWAAFRAAREHGAKVGFRTFVIIMGLTSVPMGVLMSFLPAVRESAQDSQENR